jgi:RNA polymerase sigma-70 factor (ECF subfamily)
MDPPELAATVDRARGGDAEALAELYRRFDRRVLGLCRHILRTPAAAEDARGEVFLRLGRALRGYDPAQPFTPWLLSVASHHCLDVLRRQRLEGRLFVDAEAEAVAVEADPVAASPLGQLIGDERRDAVRAAIEALPERYRLPLVLRYYGELGYEAIGAQLGLKRNHVATLIFRGKQELRRRLDAVARG